MGQERLEQRIIELLEDPMYDWRTLAALRKGVADLTVSEEIVTNLLDDLEKRGLVVRAFSPKSSQSVYTTLRHYKLTHSSKEIALSSLSGSIQY